MLRYGIRAKAPHAPGHDNYVVVSHFQLPI